MTDFRVIFTAETTDGPRTLTSDPMPLSDAQDTIAGVIGALGDENVIRVIIERTDV